MSHPAEVAKAALEARRRVKNPNPVQPVEPVKHRVKAQDEDTKTAGASESAPSASRPAKKAPAKKTAAKKTAAKSKK